MTRRLGLRLGQMVLVGSACAALVVGCGSSNSGGGATTSGGSGGTDAGGGSGGSAGSGAGGSATGGTGGSATGGTGGSATGGTGGSATGGTGGSATGGTGGSAAGGTGGTGGTGTGGTGGTGTGGTGGSGACDLSGTWGTYINAPVTWKGTLALASGNGHLREWLLSTRTHNGNKTVDKAVPCAIQLPDFKGSSIAGGESYGLRFPTASFDKGKVPATTLNGTLSGSTTGSTFSTPNTALLLGLSMNNAATATWPGSPGGITPRDDDADSNPAFTTRAATASGYSNFPLNLVKSSRADRLYIATRTVAALSGKLTSCTQIDGSVKFAVIGGTPAINSHIVGCRKVGGGGCNNTQRDFVDSNSPAFVPGAGSVMKSIKLSANATCADVRSALP